VLATRKVHQPVDAAPHADEPTAMQVLGEELRVVPSLCRLGGSHKTLLGSGRLVELVPVWGPRGACVAFRGSTNINQKLIFVQRRAAPSGSCIRHAIEV
jgi:hypothetical protein